MVHWSCNTPFIHFKVTLTEEREPVILPLKGPWKASLWSYRYTGFGRHRSFFPRGMLCLPIQGPQPAVPRGHPWTQTPQTKPHSSPSTVTLTPYALGNTQWQSPPATWADRNSECAGPHWIRKQSGSDVSKKEERMILLGSLSLSQGHGAF